MADQPGKRQWSFDPELGKPSPKSESWSAETKRALQARNYEGILDNYQSSKAAGVISGAPTPSQAVPSQTASKFAGGLTAGLAAGDIAAGGLAIAGAGFDVMSLLSSNEKGVQTARELAQTFVNSGITDYKTAMSIAQKDGQLERAIGDIGFSDYAKTAAGIGANAPDLLVPGLGIVTGALGSVAQIDMQEDKRKRNQAFREQFDLELANRGLR